MYKNIIFLIISIVVFNGCMNKRGISATYYNECREYYDVQGYYRSDCDKNLIEFSDVKAGAVQAYESAKQVVTHTEHVKPEHKVVW